MAGGTTRFDPTRAAISSEGAIPSGAEVLILGGYGQLGEALAAAAAPAGRAPRGVAQLGRGDVDVTDAEGVEATLQRHRPRLVINCAVFQPVDRCETEPAAAFAVNATGAGIVARASRRVRARVIHVSTDYVFGGSLRRPYRESDLPAPRNVYAASKLAGEHLVLAASELHMVVRTSAVFGVARPGHGSPSFIERMLRRARDGQPTRVVHDQTVSPTSAVDLAGRIWDLAACGGSGLFHAANSGAATWFEIAEIAFDAFGARRLLSPTTAEEFGAPAPRPAYTALESERSRALGLAPLPPWRDAVVRHLSSAHPELSLPV